jgi:thioredoxin 1
MADQIASTITVNNQDFTEKVLQDPKMVAVNFFSEQSSSCEIFAPEFAAVSQELKDRVTFAQVDVADNESLIKQYSIDGIPTVVFFKGGQEIHRIKGIVMRDKLRRQVEGTLVVSSHTSGDDTN